MTDGARRAGQPIEGRYFDPGASRAWPARMRVGGHMATITIDRDGRSETLVREILSVGARLGNVPRRIELEGGGLFEAPADAVIEAAVSGESRMLARVFALEASWRTVAVLVVATIVLIAVLFRYGLPAIANVAAHATPVSVSQVMGATTLETVDQTLLSPSELPAERRQELTGRFEELAAAANMGNAELELVFRSSPIVGANAFALPGGTVILTDELVELAEHPDEIDGVLAHEIAHVEAHHTLQTLYRAAGLAIMIAVIAGDSGQMVDTLISQAAVLQELSYSREFEADADLRSVELMLAAGGARNPLAFIDLLDRLIEQVVPGASQREEGFLSTHPGNPNRREAVLRHARELGWGG